MYQKIADIFRIMSWSHLYPLLCNCPWCSIIWAKPNSPIVRQTAVLWALFIWLLGGRRIHELKISCSFPFDYVNMWLYDLQILWITFYAQKQNQLLCSEKQVHNYFCKEKESHLQWWGRGIEQLQIHMLILFHPLTMFYL